MNKASPSKRTYDATKRQAAAAQSRANILAAAQALFMRTGYQKTKIAMIAESAGVSNQTVYALFKSKLGILRHIMDAYPADKHSALVAEAAQATCPKEKLALAAKLACQIYAAESAQAVLLDGIAAIAPELKALSDEREARRYARLAPVVHTMVKDKVLNPVLDEDKALDIFWALTGRDMYRLLVTTRGWSEADYERWLSQALVAQLLAD